MEGYLHGAKDIALTKQDVEFLLTEIHKAKEELNKETPNESVLRLHLNNIGAKLTNR